jgi:hypothetical protein
MPVADALGAGPFGSEAHLELGPMPPRIRTFHLLYDDHRSWLEDQMKLAGTVTAMEGGCAPVPLGLRGTGGVRKPYATWLFPLQLAVEYDDVPPDLPAGLTPYRVLHVEDDEARFFPTRHDARFAGMKRLGGWDLPHPSVSALIDPETLLDLLPQILGAIPPTLGEAHRQLAMVDTRGAPALFPSAGQGLIERCRTRVAHAPASPGRLGRGPASGGPTPRCSASRAPCRCRSGQTPGNDSDEAKVRKPTGLRNDPSALRRPQTCA